MLSTAAIIAGVALLAGKSTFSQSCSPSLTLLCLSRLCERSIELLLQCTFLTSARCTDTDHAHPQSYGQYVCDGLTYSARVGIAAAISACFFCVLAACTILTCTISTVVVVAVILATVFYARRRRLRRYMQNTTATAAPQGYYPQQQQQYPQQQQQGGAYPQQPNGYYIPGQQYYGPDAGAWNAPPPQYVPPPTMPQRELSSNDKAAHVGVESTANGNEYAAAGSSSYAAPNGPQPAQRM